MKKKFIIWILIILFSIIYFPSCKSDTIKKNGIIFEKVTVIKTDKTRIEGYSVAGSYQNITVLNIPSSINGLPVIKFKDKAFINNTTIKEIIVPNTISRPALNLDAPFSGCNNVEKITVPFSAFSGLFFNGGNSSINQRERLPKSLRYLYLTNDCIEIDSRDFYYCTSLREIHIPNSVKIINDGGYWASGAKYWDGLPFLGCSINLRIFCEANSKPSQWGKYWNYLDAQTPLTVIWGEY
jgi:hypothetical protein